MRKVAKQLKKARVGIEFLIESTKHDKELASIIGSELARQSLISNREHKRVYATEKQASDEELQKKSHVASLPQSSLVTQILQSLS